MKTTRALRPLRALVALHTLIAGRSLIAHKPWCTGITCHSCYTSWANRAIRPPWSLYPLLTLWALGALWALRTL